LRDFISRPFFIFGRFYPRKTTGSGWNPRGFRVGGRSLWRSRVVSLPMLFGLSLQLLMFLSVEDYFLAY
jgi:hypothetical protein